jgi:hypothetical protein
VQITVAPNEEQLAKVRDAVGHRAFASAAVRWSAVPAIEPRDVVRPPASRGEAAVRVWIDLTRPRSTRLYFANAAGARFLVRDLSLSTSFDAVDREAVGQVLELAVSALLEDDRVGLSRQQMESLLGAVPEAPRPPAPPPKDAVPPPVPAWRPTLDVAVSYTVQAFADAVPVAHGPGLAVDVGAVHGPLALSLWTTGQYQVPQSFEQSGVGIELSALAVRAGFEGALRIAPRRAGRLFSETFAGVRLGAGVDFVRVRPFAPASDPGLMLSAPYWRTVPVLVAGVRFVVSVGDDVEVVAEPMVDFVLTRAHYDVMAAGGSSTLLSPFTVRPGATLAVGWR